MTKLDLKAKHKKLYQAKAAPSLIDVPEVQFLSIDGSGDPNNSPTAATAIEALYGLSYTMKFASKNATPGRDWTVMPLEGLWWADDMSAFTVGARQDWKWTFQIMQPDFLTSEMLKNGMDALSAKKDNPLIRKARLETIAPAKCAHILHIGPWSEEAPTIAKLHEFIHDQGFALCGKHREIYLSDPRRVEPSRLRTIIRQPMKAS